MTTHAQPMTPEELHRDLVSRLGFGNNITEPMADNDTIVRWHEEQSGYANEWQESQLWRNDCYAAGHLDTEDCFEHDPSLQAQALRKRVEAVLMLWGGYLADYPELDHEHAVYRSLRAALDPS